MLFFFLIFPSHWPILIKAIMNIREIYNSTNFKDLTGSELDVNKKAYEEC